MKVRPVAVKEFAAYQRRADDLFDRDEQAAIVDLIAYEPTAGMLIPGTGGLRKLRVGRESSGKRGGARIVYYFYNEDFPILLLALYAKNEKSDLTAGQKREMTALVTRIVRQWKKS